MDHRLQRATKMKRALDAAFFKKGLAIAIMSGICYGLFTAFLNYGMARGVWTGWQSGENGMSPFVVTYIIGALGSSMMYTASALWSLGLSGIKGALGDFFRSLNTKPGRMIMLAALMGGPVAGTAYVIALQKAGSIVIPISALSTAIGAILGRVLYKQVLNARMMVGIVVCFIASMMIAGTSLTGEVKDGMMVGVLMAFVAAFGWGMEGVIAGYSTAMLDSQVGITIRQCVSAVANVCILLPALSVMSGEGVTYAWQLMGSAITDTSSVLCFVLSGFFAMYSYSLWYKGNSMCGAALGMAASGAYSFWGPFFCWLIIGVLGGQDGWAIAPIGWVSAIVMVVGIVIIAMDPRDLLKKRGA